MVGQESACQCWRCNRYEFDPWVGKIPERRQWQPTPVVLPGKSHGQRSLAGYSPWGHKESDTTTTRGKHSGKFPKAPRELDSQGPGYWDPSPPTSLSSCSTLASAHMGHGHPCGAPLLPTHQEASFTGPALGCARGRSVLTTDPLQLRLTQPPSRMEDS